MAYKRASAVLNRENASGIIEKLVLRSMYPGKKRELLDVGYLAASFSKTVELIGVLKPNYQKIQTENSILFRNLYHARLL